MSSKIQSEEKMVYVTSSLSATVSPLKHTNPRSIAYMVVEYCYKGTLRSWTAIEQKIVQDHNGERSNQ